MDDENELPVQPPPAIAVARRALILSGVVCRASIETYSDEEYKRETADAIREWFTDLDLWPYLDADEQLIIGCPFGEMPRRLCIRGSSFIEGVALLAWALERCAFPPHDQKVNPIAITNSLDFLDGSAKRLLESPRLREHVEI